MPRGKYVSHKGKHRRFNNPEEIQEQMQKMQKEQEWRQARGDDASSDEEKDKDDKDGKSSDDESSEESSGDEGKAKGVQHLIQIENPNRIQKKSKKVTELDVEGPSGAPQLSRREREELEKQRAQANYQRLHAMGKTDEARADLARLAIIKQQREDAAKRREAEIKEKEAARSTKAEQTQKAMGKKKT